MHGIQPAYALSLCLESWRLRRLSAECLRVFWWKHVVADGRVQASGLYQGLDTASEHRRITLMPAQALGAACAGLRII